MAAESIKMVSGSIEQQNIWNNRIKNARDCFRSILKTVPLLVLNAYNFERIRYRCFIFLHKMKQLCRILRAPHVGNSGEPGILSAMQCYDASIPYKEVGRLLSHYSARKMITASLLAYIQISISLPGMEFDISFRPW